MPEFKEIVVVAEALDGQPIPLVFELLGLAQTLARDVGGRVTAVIRSSGNLECSPLLIARGADRVFVLRSEESVQYYESELWLTGLMQVLAQTSPALILMGHTSLGAELAPRLAFRIKGSVATACEQVQMEGTKVRITRPCFGNRAREVLSLAATPAVVTVKSKTQEARDADEARHGEIVDFSMMHNETTRYSKVLERKRDIEGEGVQLEKAKVIIAGGRGLGGPNGFRLLEKLATALGGAVGASRVACDLGWCPHSWQIGLTGKTVVPDLYIAVGISGASHHMAGCGNAKAIVAINSDSDAAIFKEARFGVVGDYKQIIPAFIDELSRHKESQSNQEN